VEQLPVIPNLVSRSILKLFLFHQPFPTTGLVLFLEEDHYVAEDFVSTIHLAESVRNENYPDCDIISIGTYLKEFNYTRDNKMVKYAASTIIIITNVSI
jgi:hypothetical protein